MGNADLQTAYQQATWPLRDPNMMNTGVLQPAEMHLLNKVLTDPTGYGLSGFRNYNELEGQKNQLLETARRNLDAKRKALTPSSPPPMKGGWQKIDPAKEVADLKASGDTETAAKLEEMARLDALRKKHGISQ